MRGPDRRTEGLFSYVSCESRVPADHPLRSVLPLVDGVPSGLSSGFQRLYALNGRHSIPPEKLLQAFYSVRFERQLMEQLDYNLLFRWFVGLGVDDPVWDVTVFTTNRDRLLESEIATKFFAAVLARPELQALLSDEHFSVDGTLIQAWASMKSFRPRDGSGERDFKGEKRSNETHSSTSDPDARLFRKDGGEASRLCFIGHVLMENRNGLAVSGVLTRAAGTAEASAALYLAQGLPRGPKTLGADKGYDSRDLVLELRELGITPHIAQNAYVTERASRRSATDGRTTRHPGYARSQKRRKRIEEIFGWLKSVGGCRQTKFRGLERVGMAFTLALAAYNLIRIPKLLAQAA